MLMPQGRGGPAKGRRRMEIRKDPCCRPTNTNRARLSAPPVLEMRDGLPPVKSATSGARLRASRPTFKAVPFTCTVSVRCSPGTRGEESASSDNDTKVIEKEELARLAQAMPTTAGPGARSAGGTATRDSGEDASTNPGRPATRT